MLMMGELLLVCLGFWCGTALPASIVQVRLGEDAALHCPLLDPDSEYSGAHNRWSALSWYRKAEGQRPHLLLIFRATDGSNLKYGSGVRPDKVSVAANGSLLLRVSEHSDSAVYYCGISGTQREPNCCSYCLVWSNSTFGHSPSYFMVFSAGTQLLVKTEEQNQTMGYSSPTVQILATLPPHQDPASPHLLVCLLTGLSSPVQNILWWVNDRMEMSTGTAVTPDGSGTYSASSVWELSAADWRSRSTYWCGTVQAGRVYRQRLCPQNRVCLDSHTRFTNRACQRF